MASGATTGMRKRSPSENRRVGIISTPSERVRKTSVSKRTPTVALRGRPVESTETPEEHLDRLMNADQGRTQSNPVPIQP
eukprot:978005-Heterocapsa_arctica.AAC.1